MHIAAGIGHQPVVSFLVQREFVAYKRQGVFASTKSSVGIIKEYPLRITPVGVESGSDEQREKKRDRARERRKATDRLDCRLRE